MCVWQLLVTYSSLKIAQSAVHEVTSVGHFAVGTKMFTAEALLTSFIDMELQMHC